MMLTVLTIIQANYSANADKVTLLAKITQPVLLKCLSQCSCSYPDNYRVEGHVLLDVTIEVNSVLIDLFQLTP